MSVQVADVKSFWDRNPCGSLLSRRGDRRAYFAEIERRRYETEWHVPLVGRFAEYRGRDVLELGCGLGTDGLQFARHGARYAGVDLSPASLALSRERFELNGAAGRFACVNGEELPLRSSSFDHVYSFGVIHHSPDTEAIVREIRRVLRPGGTFCVMIYNKQSINYHLEIMLLRRLLRVVLYPRFMPGLLARLTGLSGRTLAGHREVLLKKRRMSREEWISINTDGPQCPLAKVYTRREALDLFRDFGDVRTEVWHFDRAHWPLIGRLLPERLCRWLGRRWGWHRIVYGVKPAA